MDKDLDGKHRPPRCGEEPSMAARYLICVLLRQFEQGEHSKNEPRRWRLGELHVFAMIYNLIRLVMLQAAERQGVPTNRISFIDAMRWLDAAQPNDTLAKLVVLPHRPHRYEPRVRKRRPKKYKLERVALTCARRAAVNLQLSATSTRTQ